MMLVVVGRKKRRWEKYKEKRIWKNKLNKEKGMTTNPTRAEKGKQQEKEEGICMSYE